MAKDTPLSREKLFDAARQLSPQDRADLFYDLWDDLIVTAPDLLEPSPALVQELERRVAAHEANPQEGDDWEVVKVRLLNQFL